MESVELNRHQLTTVRLPEALEQAFGISRSQARQFLKDGAVKIDGEKYTWLTCCVGDIDGKVVQIGKRKFARMQVEINEA